MAAVIPNTGFRHSDVGIGARADPGRPADAGAGRHAAKEVGRRQGPVHRQPGHVRPDRRARPGGVLRRDLRLSDDGPGDLQRGDAAAEGHRRQADAGAARDRAGQARQQDVGRHFRPDQYPGAGPDQVPERSLGRAGDRAARRPAGPARGARQERREEPGRHGRRRAGHRVRRGRRADHGGAGRRPTTSKTRRSSSSSTRS